MHCIHICICICISIVFVFALVFVFLIPGKIRGLLPYQPVYSKELTAKLGLQVERKERRVKTVFTFMLHTFHTPSGEEGEEGKNLFIFSYLHTSYKPKMFIQGVSKKGSFMIPASLEALGCSKGLDISQKHCQTSFFG